MSKRRALIAKLATACVACTSATLGIATAAHADAVPAASPSLANVCLTVTPKTLGVTVNGQTLLGASLAVRQTCLGV